VITVPLGSDARVSFAVCTAEVESVVSEESGTLTDAVKKVCGRLVDVSDPCRAASRCSSRYSCKDP
jgi:hypothetical protein